MAGSGPRGPLWAALVCTVFNKPYVTIWQGYTEL